MPLLKTILQQHAQQRAAAAGHGYTERAMDRVRLGRALGYGARHAARTLVQAVDAASAPGPARPAAEPAQRPAAAERVTPVSERAEQVRANAAQTKAHAGRLGRSVWTPLAQYSSVLWLQVTGTFFAVIAVFLAQGVWKQHAAWRMWRSHDAEKLYVVTALFLVFAYLAVSNFVRAARRERRKT